MPVVLLALCLIAVVLRFAAGLLRGRDLVYEGYGFYADIARTFWEGGGVCYDTAARCTIRMPLYPVLVSPLVAADAVFPWLIVFQALIGGAIVYLTFEIGRRLFDTRIAMIAAACAAVNPYSVMHASAFQETKVFNALMLLTIYLLLRSWQEPRRWIFIAAGVSLALATLTTVRMALFIPLAFVWVLAADPQASLRVRAGRAMLLAAPLVVLLGAWSARNYRLIGSPVLSTEAGLSLWIANNPVTMQVLPNSSVDLIEDRALELLGPQEQSMIAALSDDPAAQDRYFAALAWRFIATDPVGASWAALQRMIYGFGGWLSPARDGITQLAYAAVFVPLNVLAVIGLWRSRRAGPPHLLVILLFAAFLVTTAIFWAHTSHRSFLHPLKFMYAAAALAPALSTRLRRGPAVSAFRY